LLGKKHDDFSRAQADKFTVNPKLSKFFMRSGNHHTYAAAPYFSSAIDAHNQVMQNISGSTTLPDHDSTPKLNAKALKREQGKGPGDFKYMKSAQIRSTQAKKFESAADSKNIDKDLAHSRSSVPITEPATDQSQSELPPIHHRSTMIPTIRNAIPNRKHLSMSSAGNVNSTTYQPKTIDASRNTQTDIDSVRQQPAKPNVD